MSDELGLKIMQKMVKQRKDAANIFVEQGREDLAEKETARSGCDCEVFTRASYG